MKVPGVTSTKHGLETLSFRGCQIWNMLPGEFKCLSSVPKFKEQTKSWSGSNCNCQICQTVVLDWDGQVLQGFKFLSGESVNIDGR